MNMVEILLT